MSFFSLKNGLIMKKCFIKIPFIIICAIISILLIINVFYLQVHAKHEEKSDSKSVYREYNREFLLPKGTNPEAIKSSLSKDGVLTVEAPLPALGGPDKLIPISHH